MQNIRASARRWGLFAIVFLVAPNLAVAEVELSLRSTETFARVGEPFIVELVATSTSESDEPIASMSVILTWDSDAFASIEPFSVSGAPWMVLGFLQDPDGINTVTEDGNVILTGLAFPGNLVQASPDGTVVAILEFVGLNRMPPTPIAIPSNIGVSGATSVSAAPGENKVGQLEGVSVPVAECGVPDSDFDGDVDLTDMAGFEQCLLGVGIEINDFCACVFDLDEEGLGDGDVDLADWAEFAINFSPQNP